MNSQEELQQQFDEDLSKLLHEYEDLGLPPNKITDSLSWHAELARSRDKSGRVIV